MLAFDFFGLSLIMGKSENILWNIIIYFKTTDLKAVRILGAVFDYSAVV
jgi:hypothetical protein